MPEGSSHTITPSVFTQGLFPTQSREPRLPPCLHACLRELCRILNHNRSCYYWYTNYQLHPIAGRESKQKKLFLSQAGLQSTIPDHGTALLLWPIVFWINNFYCWGLLPHTQPRTVTTDANQNMVGSHPAAAWQAAEAVLTLPNLTLRLWVSSYWLHRKLSICNK